jgi:benzoate/toluate 1,2-dioxygenase beta subunit
MDTLEQLIKWEFATNRLIAREAMCLDQRRWRDWRNLYADDCIFVMPTWKSAEEINNGNPELRLNLIYLKGRGQLDDRIFRVESRDSYASTPLDRTSHVVGSVVVDAIEGESVFATAGWIVRSYSWRQGTTLRSGRYAYELLMLHGELKIARKEIIIVDDCLEGSLDFYHV